MMSTRREDRYEANQQRLDMGKKPELAPRVQGVDYYNYELIERADGGLTLTITDRHQMLQIVSTNGRRRQQQNGRLTIIGTAPGAVLLRDPSEV